MGDMATLFLRITRIPQSFIMSGKRGFFVNCHEFSLMLRDVIT